MKLILYAISFDFGSHLCFWGANILGIQWIKEHENSLDNGMRVSCRKADTESLVVAQPLDLLAFLYKFQVFSLCEIWISLGSEYDDARFWVVTHIVW
jgi:hypothetical protein